MYIATTKQTLHVVLEGTEQLLAFRAKITVQKQHITAVSWQEAFSDWPSLEIRMPGSYLPAWIMAGSYWNEEGWDFIFAKKPKGMLKPTLFNVLVITTSQHRYRRIILGTSKQKAAEVLSWWEERL